MASLLAVSLGLAVPILASEAAAAPAAPVSPESLLGSQGSDVALADTESAVTLPGFGRYQSMSFRVSKTRALTNEAVSVSWSGGAPGSVEGSIEGTNFVQIMQCWGDPVKAADGTMGPPPEQCVFGADPDALRTNINDNGFEFIRARMPTVDDWVPFKAVDGKVIKSDTGQNPNNPSSGIWINPYYSKYTSNEVGGLRSGPEGSGSAFFEIHTGLQNAGLGCGQRQKRGRIPRCWLVVVPRGPHDDITGVDDRGIAATTPLDKRGPWKNRVAFSLNFTPVKSSCALSNDQESISGADLTLPAMDRWLPRLCTQAGAPPYIYTRTQDDRARTLLGQRAQGGAGDGMIITNAPIDPVTLPAGRHAVYAPMDVSAIVIGFSIQRNNVRDGLPDTVLKAFDKVQSTYVAHIKLTPRLVAKLLTQSYAAYLSPGTAFQPDEKARAKYAWSVGNPQTMMFDQDFISLNPEFGVLGPVGIESATTLEVSLGSSAAATAVWQWVKADQAATAWLAGKPDQWGMRVNPYFSTVAAHNPNKTAFQLPPSGGFPKNDPLSWIMPDAKLAKLPELSLNNEWPYQESLTSTAKVTRTGNRGAKITYSPDVQGYAPAGSQPLGTRAMLSITDAADAQRFGIQMAALQNANGEFVEPTDQGLTAAVRAMKADPASGVLQTDFRAKPAGAYPLTTVDYAASVPSVLSAKERKDYARLLTFVAGQGQTSGEALGQLPRGYLPLPANLRAATLAASFQVGAGLPALITATTTSSTPTSSSTSTTTTATSPTTTMSTVTRAPLSTTTFSTTVTSTSFSQLQATTPTTAQPLSSSVAAGVPGPSNRPTRAGRPRSSTRTATTLSSTPVVTSTSPSPTQPSSTQPSSTQPNSTKPPVTDVQLASSPTAADPPTAPWVAILFAVGLAAAVGVPVVRRIATKQRS